MPKVSVVMPCYNHAEYVGQAINSVLSQTYTDFEFLILDNGSTDNSYDIIRRFNDSRIRVFRLPQNDIIAAVKILLDNAMGEYIAMMYSDDMWENEKLQKQMDVLENGNNVLLCATWAVYVNDNMEVIEENNIFKKKNRSRIEWIKYLLENGNCLSMCSVVARSDIFRKYLMNQSGYWQLPDYNAWLLALQETNIYMIEEILVKLRIHGGEKNQNISYPSTVNAIRTLTEQMNILLQTIERIKDEDFLEMYRDKLIYPEASTHLEVLCEKFFILLDFAKKNIYAQDNVLYFYYKYFSYEEDGISMGEVLEEKYHYTQIDFSAISGEMGRVAELIRKNEHETILLKKLRALLPDEIRYKLIQINNDFDGINDNLQNNNVPGVLQKFISCLDEVERLWDVLGYMEISINKEEIILCKQLCKKYVKHADAVDRGLLIECSNHIIQGINQILV